MLASTCRTLPRFAEAAGALRYIYTCRVSGTRNSQVGSGRSSAHCFPRLVCSQTEATLIPLLEEEQYVTTFSYGVSMAALGLITDQSVLQSLIRWQTAVYEEYSQPDGLLVST